MVGVAFHVDQLRRHVLGAVAQGVDDDAATHRAVRAMERVSVVREIFKSRDCA
jgi:hypothetical protein